LDALDTNDFIDESLNFFIDNNLSTYDILKVLETLSLTVVLNMPNTLTMSEYETIHGRYLKLAADMQPCKNAKH